MDYFGRFALPEMQIPTGVAPPQPAPLPAPKPPPQLPQVPIKDMQPMAPTNFNDLGGIASLGNFQFNPGMLQNLPQSVPQPAPQPTAPGTPPAVGGALAQPPGLDYLSRYQDVAQAYDAQNLGQSPHILANGGDADGSGDISREEYARWHFEQMGQGEGRTFGDQFFVPGQTPPTGGGLNVPPPPSGYTPPSGQTPPTGYTPPPNQPPANTHGLVETAFGLINPERFSYLFQKDDGE